MDGTAVDFNTRLRCTANTKLAFNAGMSSKQSTLKCSLHCQNRRRRRLPIRPLSLNLSGPNTAQMWIFRKTEKWDTVTWHVPTASGNTTIRHDAPWCLKRPKTQSTSARNNVNSRDESGLTPISRRLIYCGDVVLGFRLHPLGEMARCSNRWFFVNYTNLLFFDIFWPRTCILTILRYFRNCKCVLFMSCHL